MRGEGVGFTGLRKRSHCTGSLQGGVVKEPAYRGTSRIRNRNPAGLYSLQLFSPLELQGRAGTMSRLPWRSKGGGAFSCGRGTLVGRVVLEVGDERVGVRAAVRQRPDHQLPAVAPTSSRGGLVLV